MMKTLTLCSAGHKVSKATPKRSEAHNAALKVPANSRRMALSTMLGIATTLAAAPSLLLPPVAHADSETSDTGEYQISEEDLVFTDRVFFDIGLCPEGVRADRRLGDKSILCSDPEPLGRIVIGLYGNVAPNTVSNFKRTVEAGSYNGTLLPKIVPGKYLIAGQQGSKRSGLVQPPSDLPSNGDILSSKAFRLPHRRPGTVSLNLTENMDDDFFRYEKDYRNCSFLITTGPGPVPSLDGENIVFGQVIEGLDVVSNIVATVPLFMPNGNLRAFNELGRFIGDERASKTSAKWGKPLKSVLFVNSGVL